MIKRLVSLLLLFPFSTFAAFQLTSPNFKSGDTVPLPQVLNAHGCKGDNISPELSWQGAPAGTKAFAVTVFDPDANAGSGWWHWVVINIPTTVTKLAANAGNPKLKKLPKNAIQTATNYDIPGYSGPCPPLGEPAHHYIFTVYALKKPLDNLVKAPPGTVNVFIQQNKLDSAVITLTYQHK